MVRKDADQRFVTERSQVPAGLQKTKQDEIVTPVELLPRGIARLASGIVELGVLEATTKPARRTSGGVVFQLSDPTPPMVEIRGLENFLPQADRSASRAERMTFEQLYQHLPDILRTLSNKFGQTDPQRIEDAVQNAFLKAHQRWDIEGFRPSVGTIVFYGIQQLINMHRWDTKRPSITRSEEENVFALEHARADTSTEDQALGLMDVLGGIPYAEMLVASAMGTSQRQLGEYYGYGERRVSQCIQVARDELFRRVGISQDVDLEVGRRRLAAYLSGDIDTVEIPVESETESKSIREYKWREGVPIEVQIAGYYLRRAKKASGIEGITVKIAEAMGVGRTTVHRFEHGERYIDLNRVYKAAVDCGIEPDDPWVEKIAELMRGQDWLRVLAQPNMTLQRALDFLRLEHGMTEEDFARVVDINGSLFTKYINGAKSPFLYNLSKILINAGIDPRSKAGQFFHLLNTGTELLFAEEFRGLDDSDKLNYIRASLGLTVAKTGKLLFYSRSHIGNMASGRKVMSDKASAGVARLSGLNNTPQEDNGDGTTESLSPEDELLQLLRGPILFRDHILQVQRHRYWLAPQDDELYQQVRQIDRKGKVLQKVRTTKGLTYRQINERILARGGRFQLYPMDDEVIPVSHGPRNEVINIAKIEKGQSKVNPLTIAQYLYGLGLDFLNPISQYAVNCV